MKKPVVKAAKSKTARLRVAFEIEFDARDREAAEQAGHVAGNAFAAVLALSPPQKRQDYVNAVEGAMKKAVSK